MEDEQEEEGRCKEEEEEEEEKSEEEEEDGRGGKTPRPSSPGHLDDSYSSGSSDSDAEQEYETLDTARSFATQLAAGTSSDGVLRLRSRLAPSTSTRGSTRSCSMPGARSCWPTASATTSWGRA